jgi:nitrate/TMAO reductase-like tetraheme cytochrome c subunit
MRDFVYEEYKQSTHFMNASGVGHQRAVPQVLGDDLDKGEVRSQTARTC